jgi:hypothetical protein
MSAAIVASTLALLRRHRRRWPSCPCGRGFQRSTARPVAALIAEPRAQAMFEILTRQNRYSIRFRISDATLPATRARRVNQFVATLARGGSVYPQKRTL